MQTAYNLLKNHPHFDQIRFIIVPFCREHIHTSSDVPLPHSESAAIAKELFPNVDTETYFSDY